MSLYLYLALKDKKMPKYIIYTIMSDVYDIYDIIKMNAMPLIKMNINKISKYELHSVFKTNNLKIIKYVFENITEKIKKINGFTVDALLRTDNVDIINYIFSLGIKVEFDVHHTYVAEEVGNFSVLSFMYENYMHLFKDRTLYTRIYHNEVAKILK